MPLARELYVRYLRPHLRTELAAQRLKLVWFAWGYAGVCSLRAIPLYSRLRLVFRFLRVDWYVPHAHEPSEITKIVRVLAERRAQPGEGIVEAGCYRGGSTAKFSIAARLLGYRLWVYDSFQGVEPLTESEKQGNYDFSGEYAAPQELVERNVTLYGERGVCSFVKGWFQDTLASSGVPGPVRLAYIDCDAAKGTEDALTGILPALTHDGVVFSQDFHIHPVRRLLLSPDLWKRLHSATPQVQPCGDKLACLRFGFERAGAETH